MCTRVRTCVRVGTVRVCVCTWVHVCVSIMYRMRVCVCVCVRACVRVGVWVCAPVRPHCTYQQMEQCHEVTVLLEIPQTVQC